MPPLCLTNGGRSISGALGATVGVTLAGTNLTGATINANYLDFYLSFGLGLSRKAGFHVTELPSPTPGAAGTRLVIDLQPQMLFGVSLA